MAGTLTHAHFIMDVYDSLGLKSRELLLSNKEQLKTFAQSMDVLYFYNLLSLRPGKKVRDFGHYFHNNNVNDFFTTLVNYIKYNNYQYNPDVMSFLYGTLSHYILDSHLHPYVIYKTGEFHKEDPNTYKYNMKHNIMENYIDTYYVNEKESVKPSSFKCHNYCFNVGGLNKSLIEVINFTYKEVFGIENFSVYYLKSIKQMRTFYRIFRYDPTGLKKYFYKCVDLVCPRSLLIKTPLSFNIKINDKDNEYFLNLNKKEWFNPTEKKNKRTSTVIDIYNNSLEKTVETIRSINSYLYYDEEIDLKKVIGNNSYITGKNCDNDKELINFEE